MFVWVQTDLTEVFLEVVYLYFSHLHHQIKSAVFSLTSTHTHTLWLKCVSVWISLKLQRGEENLGDEMTMGEKRVGVGGLKQKGSCQISKDREVLFRKQTERGLRVRWDDLEI